MANGRFSRFPAQFALGLLQLQQQQRQQAQSNELARRQLQQAQLASQVEQRLAQQREQRLGAASEAQTEVAKARLALDVERVREERKASLGKAISDFNTEGSAFFPSSVGDRIKDFVGEDTIVTPIPGAGFVVRSAKGTKFERDLRANRLAEREAEAEIATEEARARKFNAEAEATLRRRGSHIRNAPLALQQVAAANERLLGPVFRQVEFLKLQRDNAFEPTVVEAANKRIAELEAEPWKFYAEDNPNHTALKNAQELVPILTGLIQRQATGDLPPESRATPDQQHRYAQETGIDDVTSGAAAARMDPQPQQNHKLTRQGLPIFPDGKIDRSRFGVITEETRGGRFARFIVNQTTGEWYLDPSTLEASLKALKSNPRLRRMVPPDWRTKLQRVSELRLPIDRQPAPQKLPSKAQPSRQEQQQTEPDRAPAPTTPDLNAEQAILEEAAQLKQQFQQLPPDSPERDTIRARVQELGQQLRAIVNASS